MASSRPQSDPYMALPDFGRSTLWEWRAQRPQSHRTRLCTADLAADSCHHFVLPGGTMKLEKFAFEVVVTFWLPGLVVGCAILMLFGVTHEQTQLLLAWAQDA